MTDTYMNDICNTCWKINDEKTTAHTQCPAMVIFPDKSRNNNGIHNVTGDVDHGMGDICFNGSVHVYGNVRSGSSIQATGCVLVEGSVEAAEIKAGGNVVVKGGMQGAYKGKIEAGGGVDILYVECGSIIADGPVIFDTCIHSYIESEETVIAKGRRGAIIGGYVSSSGDIVANYIGAISNSYTEVTTGVITRKQARIRAIEKEIEKLTGEIENLNHLGTYFENAMLRMESDVFSLLKQSGIENVQYKRKKINIYNTEKEKLKKELAMINKSKIHVIDTIFPGSKIIIDASELVVNDKIFSASFKYTDNNIIFGPCELSCQNAYDG